MKARKDTGGGSNGGRGGASGRRLPIGVVHFGCKQWQLTVLVMRIKRNVAVVVDKDLAFLDQGSRVGDW